MNKTITLTDEQWAALQAGEAITIEPPKPKIVPWEPKRGEWYVGIGGSASQGSITKWCAAFGNEFPAKEQAEAEAKAMRARNRLAAYVREFASDWEADWSDDDQRKWCLIFDHSVSKWQCMYFSSTQSPERVYMPEHVAHELVEKLKSGEVVL